MSVAIDNLILKADQWLLHEPNPPQCLTIPNYYTDYEENRKVSQIIEDDTTAAYTLALAYKANGNENYATKSKEVLSAWSKCLDLSGSEAELYLTYKGQRFLEAAWWLNGDIPIEAKEWLKTIYWKAAKGCSGHWNNWGAAGLWGRIALNRLFGNENTLPLYQEIRGHFNRANWRIPLLSRPGEFWLENFRGYSGMEYNYFSASWYLKSALALCDTYLLDKLREHIESIYNYALHPETWRFKMKFPFWPCANSLQCGSPGSWPSDLLGIAGVAYGVVAWQVYGENALDVCNPWSHSSARIELGLL